MNDDATSGLEPTARNPKSSLIPTLIVLLSAVYKLVLLAFNAVPFNGDEAIVALMARHILQGERPVFFYGQAYLGATDAWLVAASFTIFGESVLAIRVVHILLFAGVVLTTYLLARAMCTANGSARGYVVDGAAAGHVDTLYHSDIGWLRDLVAGNVSLLADSQWLLSELAAGRWLLFASLPDLRSHFPVDSGVPHPNR
jgi:hypothetical protein